MIAGLDSITTVKLVGMEVTDKGPEVRLWISPGRVTLRSMSDSRIGLQMVDMRQELDQMELKMEQFYSDLLVDPSHLVVGMQVAVLYSDMAWHRVVVVRVRGGRPGGGGLCRLGLESFSQE